MTALPPPPPAHVWLVDQAADYYRDLGVNVSDYRVEGEPLFHTDAAAEVSSYPGVSVMRLSRWLEGQPRAVLSIVVLHEVAHVAQRNVALADWRGPRTGSGWREGMAEALAHDHLCPFMARTWGRRVALRECRGWRVTYPREVAEFRSVSARVSGGGWTSVSARAWRLQSLRSVSWEVGS